jgi:hypothetical protein
MVLKQMLGKKCMAEFMPHSVSSSEGDLVKVKVKFTLEQAMKAQMGSTGIALLFL